MDYFNAVLSSFRILLVFFFHPAYFQDKYILGIILATDRSFRQASKVTLYIIYDQQNIFYEPRFYAQIIYYGAFW